MLSEPYYPIGIQDFSEMRKLNAVYVDKTALIYRLVKSSKYVFLSRPRRFGKSLLSSTLQYYFEGRKDLFEGLAVERLETEWTAYPVLRFDLSSAKGGGPATAEAELSRQLKKFEATYNVTDIAMTLGGRLANLIQAANEAVGENVVVLIDEYDAPILDVLHDDTQREAIRMVLRDFFSPLKSCDRYLRFVFITGISMFSQLSIFSELNNLENISRAREYHSICGITETELKENFQFGIGKLAETQGCTREEIVAKLKDTYDGYHFCGNTEGMFNPFSLLNAFKKNEFDSYWFASGTPRFLIEMLGKYKQEGLFEIEMLESNQAVTPAKFETPLEMQTGPVPLLYQAGYLTIKSYDPEEGIFTLGIPNSEVRVGLMQNLLPLYAKVDAADVDSAVTRASAALRRGEPDRAMELFQSTLASIPFMRGDKAILEDAEKTEAFYHRIFFFFFRMLHNQVNAEIRSAKGAADIVIQTPKYIYIAEIKIDSTPEAALQQIDDKGYATPFLTDGRQIIRLGINFSTQTRTIDRWLQA
jgi:AcrR family transcriptional regulator